MQNIILANGCYWCTQAVFSHLNGVVETISGFYHFGTHDKVECVSITFDENIIEYIDLLQVFFCTHNPTLVKWDETDFLHYRSAIIVKNEKHYQEAIDAITSLQQDNIFDEPIQTQVFVYESGSFVEAPEKHQNYYEKQPDAPFCVSNIHPKIRKIKQIFAQHVK